MTAIIIALVLFAECGYAAVPYEPKSDELWPLVAESHIVVTGTLSVPVKSIQTALDADKHKFVELEVAPDQILKGNLPAPLRVHWYTQREDHSPSPNRVIASDGKKRLLFLVEVDDLLAFTSKIYFAGYTPRALAEPTPEFVTQVRQEIEAQRTILARFGEEFPPVREPLYKKVKELIDKTTQKETQMDAFRQLEKLGLDGVPAMIMLMDDRRDLAIPAITFVNPPGHWDGLRHYGPRKVVDAISAILNEITSQGFGSIYNGASERERQEAVNGWKIYLHHWKKQ